MLRFVAVAIVALASQAVWALGVGEIEVDTALNQPLRASIPIHSMVPGTIDQVTAIIADDRDFQRVGLERTAFVSNLAIEVVPVDGDQTRAIVNLSSRNAARDPFISFLLQVNWSGGRLLREYTIFLDPISDEPEEPVFEAPDVATSDELAPAPEPVWAEPEPPASTESIVSEPVYDEPAPAPASAPIAVDADGVPKPEVYWEDGGVDSGAPLESTEPVIEGRARTESAPVFDKSSYGPIRAGETLWQVAAAVRPDLEVTPDQVMWALYQENPRAFDGNLNVLKRGATLAIPSREEMLSTPAADARRAVGEQAAAHIARMEGGAAPAAPAPPPRPAAEPVAPPKPVAAPEPVQVAQPEPEPEPLPEPEPEPVQVVEPEPVAVVEPEPLPVEPVEPEPEAEPAQPAPDVEATPDSAPDDDALAALERLAGDYTAQEDPDFIPEESDELADDELDYPMTDEEAAAIAAAEAEFEAEYGGEDPDAALAEQTAPAPLRETAPSAPDEGGGLLLWLAGGLAVIALGILAALGLRKRKAAAPAVAKGASAPVSDGIMSPPRPVSDGVPAEPPAPADDPTVVRQDEPAPAERTAEFDSEGTAEFSRTQDTVVRADTPPAAPSADATAEFGDTVVGDEPMDMGATVSMDVAPDIESTQAIDMPATGDGGSDLTDVDQTQIFQAGDAIDLGDEAVDLELNEDPLSEADFHLAYGLYDEAALLLDQAIESDPDRLELREKLLEAHFAAGKTEEFLQTAQGLKDRGPDDATWQKVAIMGQQLCPDAELFAGGAGDAGAVDMDFGSDAAVDMDFGGDDESAAPDALAGFDIPEIEAPAEPEAFESADSVADDNVIEFDMDSEFEAQAAPAEVPNADNTVEFDPEELELPEPEADEAPALEDAGNTIEFDIGDLDIPEPEPESAPGEVGGGEQVAADELPAAEQSLDLGELGSLEEAADVAMDLDVPAADEGVVTPEREPEAEQSLDLGELGDPALPSGEETVALSDAELGVEAPASEELSAADLEAELEGFDLDTDFDIGSEADANAAPGASDPANQLDLARAYVDMGEADTARGLLQDVLQAGSDEQKQEAQKLLDQLG